MKNIFIILFLAIVMPCLSQEKEPRLYKEKGKFKVEYNGKHFLANERVITIKLKDTKSLPKQINPVRANKLGFIDVKIPEKHDVSSYIEELKNSELYESVEYNSYGEYGDFNPNDTDIDDQWHLNTINMPEAWDIAKGCASANIIIGILDAGIDWEHEDIGLGTDSYQNIYLNSGEDAWTDVNDPTTGNGIDDDGNGLVDDWKGWNFDNNSNDSRPNINHGTFVAGIVGAKTNNNLGIAGVIGGNNSRGIGLLSYNLGDAPNGAVLDDAIIDAVDAGVSVIQMSLSVPSTTAINNALQYAANNDVVIVCCAMNDNSSVAYPASNSNVIAVGGITAAGTKAAFANYGSALDVVAPAVNIYSTIPNDDYDTDSGTSYAAPQVSALAALILSVNPNLTNDEVRDIIESTCAKVGGYTYSTVSGHDNGTWHEKVGYGCIDALAALEEVIDQFTTTSPAIVCYSNTTFTASNAPTCSTIDWTTSSNLTVVSGDNTLTPIIKAISSTYSGTGWVQINYILDGETTAGPRKTVWVGKPRLVDYTTIPVWLCSGTSYIFIPEIPSGTTITSITGLSGGVEVPLIGNYVVPGDVSRITLTMVNNCGSKTESRLILKANCLSFSIYPNPASNNVQLVIDGESQSSTTANASPMTTNKQNPVETYSIKIYNSFGTVFYSTKKTGKEFTIPVNNLKDGSYIVEVNDGTQSESQQLIIKH